MHSPLGFHKWKKYFYEQLLQKIKNPRNLFLAVVVCTNKAVSEYPKLKRTMMTNKKSSIKITQLLFTYLLLIPVLLSGGCVARFSTNEAGKRNLTIRNTDPMTYYLDPYFRDEQRKIDTLPDYDFVSNTRWMLVNESGAPTMLTLINDNRETNDSVVKYDFPLNKKSNKINFFKMETGSYHGELKRGDLVRRFQLSISDCDCPAQ